MSEKKNLDDLRVALFATLEGVKSGTLDLERARAVNEVAKTLVDTAKVEVDFLRATDGSQSTFIGTQAPALPDASRRGEVTSPAPNGITGIVRHRMGG